VLLVLSALALALVAALAYEVWSAERSRRAAEQAALEDNAQFAAAQLVRTLRNAIYTASSAELEPMADALGDPSLPRLLPLSAIQAGTWRRRMCPLCLEDGAAVEYFRADLPRGFLDATVPLDPAVRGAILRILRASAPTSDERRFPVRVELARVGGREWAVGYTLSRDAGGAPERAYGFLAPPAAFAQAVAAARARYPLLPGGRSDSLVSYVARDAAGNEILGSPVRFRSAASARDTTGRYVGGLTVEAVLHPAAADVLLPEGAGGSRMPYVAALLALACGLLGVGLLQLRRQDELARMRTGFIADVSHELRTPVAQIRVFADTLLLGWARTEEDRQRCLEVIARESVRLSQLIDNVLHFTRAGRRDALLEIRPVRLDAEVREALGAFAPLARAHGAEIRATLEPLRAPADRNAIRQLLLNLLNNAVRYGPDGQDVSVSLCLDGGRARLSVEDRGPGIPPADRARVWEPFVRLEREPERTTGGSGIGLAVVRALVEQHGGRCWVEDGAGGGARFVVELPAAERGEEECESTRVRKYESAGGVS
jgi:signal transduction histidine kinase